MDSCYRDVIGHSEIIDYFKNAIRSDKVGHAYLISGEQGSGKKMLATLFAQVLLCEESIEDACGMCKSCKQAVGSNHPDIIYVSHEKPNSISIEEIRRQVVSDTAVKPYASKYKIYIIVDADKMTEQAQNAILKTIEEPPSYAIIFLLAENDGALLSTIQSRCITLKLRNVKDALVKAYLMQKLEVPEYEANICAAFAQGNIGKAITLAKSERFNEIKAKAVYLLKRIYDIDVIQLSSMIKDITNYKLEIQDFFDIMAIWYRDILMYKATRNLDRLVFRDQMHEIGELANVISYEGIENVLEALETAKTRLRANVNFELTIELLLLTIKEN